jgi:hypothetical protein
MEQITGLLNVDTLTIIGAVKAALVFLKIYAAAEEA